MLTNIEIKDTFVGSRLLNVTLKSKANPPPITIAKRSDNITIPKAILMLFLLFKIYCFVGFDRCVENHNVMDKII